MGGCIFFLLSSVGLSKDDAIRDRITERVGCAQADMALLFPPESDPLIMPPWDKEGRGKDCFSEQLCC